MTMMTKMRTGIKKRRSDDNDCDDVGYDVYDDCICIGKCNTEKTDRNPTRNSLYGSKTDAGSKANRTWKTGVRNVMVRTVLQRPDRRRG